MTKDPDQPRRIELPLVLILISAFLAPIFGGYVANDSTTLEPGFAALLQAAFGGSDAPVLTHLLLAVPILAAVTIGLLQRRVQQVPKQVFSSVWLLFFIFAGVATVFTSFKGVSLYIWAEWLVYGATLFAVVSGVGRKNAPLTLMSAIGGGSFIVAVKSIMEYGSMRAGNPSWRVFGGWVNPNATAAMMLIGFFICLSLSLSRRRNEAFVAGLAAALIGFAITLTGSKGAVSLGLPIGTLAIGVALCRTKLSTLAAIWLACAVAGVAIGLLFLKNIGWVGLGISLAFFGITAGLLSGERRKEIVGRTFAIFAGAAALVLLLALATPVPAQPPAQPGQAAVAIPTSPIARVAQGTQAQEQSSQFRLNLWKSALHLVEERPVVGWGLGSYRYESGRAGLTTATLFAHNVYLQIWAECGTIPILLFVGGLGLWFWFVLRSYSNLPDSQRVVLAGVFAAVVALLTHSLVDSDLYYFGIGLSFFMLLGVGLSVSTDSVAPELIPKPFRMTAAGASILLVLLLTVFGIDDALKGNFRAAEATRDRASLEASAASLEWFGTFDGDAEYLRGLMQSGSTQLQTLTNAFAESPTQKIGRALARSLGEAGKHVEAVDTLRKARERDPSNLLTLTALMKAQIAFGNTEDAVRTATDLIGVEKTPYFTVRSIPESIPTETYLARIEVLAPNQPDPKKRADFYAGGVRGLIGYATSTFRIIQKTAADSKNDEDVKAPGYDSLREAKAKLQEGREAAKAAAEIYRGIGDKPTAAEMDAAGNLLANALGGNK